MNNESVRRSSRKVKPTLLDNYVVKLSVKKSRQKKDSTNSTNDHNSDQLSTRHDNEVSIDKLSLDLNENVSISPTKESSVQSKRVSTVKESSAASKRVSSTKEPSVSSKRVSSTKEPLVSSKRSSSTKESPIPNKRLASTNESSVQSKRLASTNESSVQSKRVSTAKEPPSSTKETPSSTKETPSSTKRLSPSPNKELLSSTNNNDNNVETSSSTNQSSTNETSSLNKEPPSTDKSSTDNPTDKDLLLNLTKDERIEYKKSEEGEFVCSDCKQSFNRKFLGERHIIIAHYGLARLNDDRNEAFSDRDILAGYKTALRILKSLKCKLCSKSFSSALGLRCHNDICGKDDMELREKCEICGSMLKFRSMKAHQDMHRRETERLELAKTRNVHSVRLMEDDSPISRRPVRSSAKKAKEFLRSSVQLDSSDSEETNPKKKRKKKDDDEGFECASDSSETSQFSNFSDEFIDELSSLKNGLSMFNLNISTEKSYQLFESWRESIGLPSRISALLKEPNNQTDLQCKLCNQQVENIEQLIFHYTKCDKELDKDWSCGLCDYTTELNLVTLLKHFINSHLNELDNVPTDLIESMIPKLSFKNNLSSFLMSEMDKFYKDNFGDQEFEEYVIKDNAISFLSQLELEQYLPDKKISPKFKILYKSENKINKQNEWNTLERFDALKDNHHLTFYTGGPVYSGAWCPYPNSLNLNAAEPTDQILCVATNVKNRLFNAFDCNPFIGCLQFWNFGKLNFNFRSVDELHEKLDKPKLEFIIPHNYGAIHEMVWCPGGTSYQAPSESSNGKLGLLALACGDGHVRILNIPHIDHLNKLSNDKIKAFKCRPIMILAKHPPCLSSYNQQTICKCISWSSTDKQRFIVSGYGNGMISIFDLKTNSSLLKKVNSSGQIELKPKKSWIGHGAIVNSIKWIPLSGSQYIVSGGFDRLCKVWSLDDMITNIILLPKKSLITNVEWSIRYCGVFLSFDDCYSNLHNNVQFRDCTLSNFSNSLTRHKTCVWDFEISQWANVQIGVDQAGEAVISTYVRPRNGKKYNKQRPYECLPLYRFTYEPLDEQEAPECSTSKRGKTAFSLNYMIDHKKPMMRTLDEMTGSYGLVFNDVNLSLYHKIPKSEYTRLKAPETMNYPRLGDYPLSSIYKVQWNPNKTSYNWVFTGTESGLCRVSYVEFLKNLDFKFTN